MEFLKKHNATLRAQLESTLAIPAAPMVPVGTPAAGAGGAGATAAAV